MTVAVAILGGAAMIFLFLSLFCLVFGFLVDDMKYLGFLGGGIFFGDAWCCLIPVYVLAITNGASLWTIIIGAFAMATPIFLLLLNFTRWGFPLFLVGYLAQIALFVLALLRV